ncbi:MAG: T9SS type A sorting domain-containing protein, partial [Rhodothermaceae bacterium]|nr:T9SS type A sorting domain-containing protein [Rhodothermaceae bacterium]
QTTGILQSDIAWDAIVLDDGEIVVVGESVMPGVPFISGQGTLARYAPDGALEMVHAYTRAPGGCGSPPAPFHSVLAEPDGHLVAGGYAPWNCGSGTEFWVVRIRTTDFVAVNSFEAPDFYGIQAQASALARQPDGKIVSAGYAGATIDSASRDVAVARHNPDGTLDDTFGTNGEVLIDVAGDDDRAYAVALQPDGKVVLAGYTYDGSQYDWLFLRLEADGAPDPSFGTDGVVVMDFDGLNDFALDCVLQPDGKILAAGVGSGNGATSSFALVRLQADGSLDSSFGAGGIATVDFTGLSARASALLLQPDGKIVAAGRTETGAGGDDTLDFAIARLNPDGTLDTAFGSGGRQTADIGGPRDTGRGLAIAPDGDLVVVGSAQEDVDGDLHSDFALARFIGDTAPVGNEPGSGLPSGFALHAAYPNPFTPSTTLRYEVPSSGRVRLAVYDALGREVAMLLDGRVAAGRHEAVFEASRLPSGVYLVRMAADGFQQTRRVTLLR